MPEETDLSFLDRPEMLHVMFPLVYSPFQMVNSFAPHPVDVPAHEVEVDRGVRIVCGFWTSGREQPTILYFHGNGETVGTHEWIAPHYTARGINLFVSDYRGYGASTGTPTVSNMLSDAHAVFSSLQVRLKADGFRESLFVMGRSLGSLPAIDVTLRHQEDIRGLIVESGAASNFRRLRDYLGLATSAAGLDEESPFLNRVKVRHIRRPTLILHGEYDEIIPVEEGKELYRNSGAQDKRIVIIPGAGHNDIMMNLEQYFGAVQDFVNRHQ